MQEMLKITGIRKAFGGNEVLRGVDLQLMGDLPRTGTVEDARMQAGLCISAECFLHIADL